MVVDRGVAGVRKGGGRVGKTVFGAGGGGGGGTPIYKLYGYVPHFRYGFRAVLV